ncbi:type IV pilus assembly protein PilV [Thiogranum longum]|uniref:Type IV pilus assembly protein PilV n=1 Tax=Thiogranum longum TaxID=1537524 RepID=A0A4R1HB06_9GAMM|nr:type IV pilus modification protein PilV [Thiogranum longum]TCK19144.1 type IV pilus assembly protein PilV [Thiogranum longum]
MPSTRHINSSRQRQGQRGFTMIEVLVTVIILSIGLLGLAGLQATSLRNNQSAFIRSQATILAYDIADRMRANAAGAANGDYQFDTGSGAPGSVANCSTSTGCTSAEMAQNDLNEWFDSVTNLLPDGTGGICIDSDPDTAGCDGVGTQFVVTITWTEVEDGSTSTFTTSFKP